MRNVSVGSAKKFSDNVYQVQIDVDGMGFSILVGKYVADSGISCLTGHDILRLLEPEGNIYLEISKAISLVNESS